MPTIHLKIRGKVQGVFYRATARDVAIKLGLTGWIKNTEEGDVEAMASGEKAQLDHFIDWCRQGPPEALVQSIETEERKETSFPDFRVIRG